MPKLIIRLPDFEATFDISTNPEIILMAAEGDEAECYVLCSNWISGMAVTQPKQSNYNGDK